MNIYTLPVLAFLASTTLAQASLHDLYGLAGQHYGHDVSPFGDVNADGVPDYLVGAPQSELAGNSVGAVYIRSGMNGQSLGSLWGTGNGERYGYSLDAVGDLDGDGVPEMILGAPGQDGSRGRVSVRSGATHVLLASFQGAVPGDQLGHDVCGMGDVNGDGVPDYAASAPWSSVLAPAGGMVTVWSGATHTPLIVRHSAAPEGLFGWSIDDAGDVQGDGRHEIVIGAPAEDAILVDSGRGYVFTYSPGSGAGSMVWSRFGTEVGGRLGRAVVGVGDVDGDGLSDVAMGAPFADGNGVDSGRVWVLRGHNGIVVGNRVGEPGSALGFALAAPGDVDGDGRADYIAGAPFSDSGGVLDRGAARVYRGGVGTVLYEFSGEGPGDEMGRSVGGAGDLNGDGFPDLIACAPLADSNGTDSGWVHLALSSALPPSTYCTAKVNSSGCTPRIEFAGCPSFSIADDFRIQAFDVHPGQPGIMIWTRAGQASLPFGGGTLCIAQPIVRTPPQIAGTFSAGVCGGKYEYGLGHSEMITMGLAPGDTIWAQYWMRDPGFMPPNGVGLTEGLEVRILP